MQRQLVHEDASNHALQCVIQKLIIGKVYTQQLLLNIDNSNKKVVEHRIFSTNVFKTSDFATLFMDLVNNYSGAHDITHSDKKQRHRPLPNFQHWYYMNLVEPGANTIECA